MHNFLVQTNWSKYQFDLGNSGYNPYENVIGPSNVSGLKTAWTAAVVGSAAVANGVVYIGNEHAAPSLHAFSEAGTTNCSGTPKTCTALWTGDTGLSEGVDTAPTVANGVVYASTDHDNLYAFSASGTTNCSGSPKICTPLWRAVVGSSVGSASPPVIANGVLYIGGDGGLDAFSASGTTNCSGSPKTCTPLWTGATGGCCGVSGAPAVSKGVVYVGSYDGLYAFSASGTTGCSGTPKTCTPLWTSTSAGHISQATAVANGVVYVTEDAGNLYAFSATGTTGCSGTPKTCTPLWTATISPNVLTSSPAVANGVVYVGGAGSGGKLVAFSALGTTNCSGTPKTCAPLWTAAIAGSSTNPSPAVANGLVYVGSWDKDDFYAFSASGTINCSGSPKTCTPLWTVTTGGCCFSISSPAVVNGKVYVAGAKLFAFSP
jgi:outer membrane protein assembly factor BamB